MRVVHVMFSGLFLLICRPEGERMAPPPVVCLPAVFSESSLFSEPHANPVDLLPAYPWSPVEPVDISVALVLIARVVPLHRAYDEVASHVLLVTVGQEDAVAVVAEAPLVLFAAGVCCCDVFDVCHVMFSGWCAPLHTPNRT